jgi:1-deoxy-D-xylulose 5-phosphate reductoisomerase
MSLPPVEARVTACHAMHGTRSARNNIREGGAILEVAMEDDDDDFVRNAILGATSLRATLLKD